MFNNQSTMLISITLIVIILVVVIVPWMWKRRQLYKLSWKLNGPFAWPLIGNGLGVIRHDGAY